MRPHLFRLATALLASAFALPLAAQEKPNDAAAQAVFQSAFGTVCEQAITQADRFAENAMQRFDVTPPSRWGEPQRAVIWKMPCMMGAYNLSHIYLIWTEYEGIQPLSFAAPSLEITYEDPEDSNSALRAVKISGWTANHLVVSSEFDPLSLTVSEFSAWRGLGDASSSAIWRMEDNGFILVEYNVDASYDGESNPERVYPAP